MTCVPSSMPRPDCPMQHATANRAPQRATTQFQLRSLPRASIYVRVALLAPGIHASRQALITHCPPPAHLTSSPYEDSRQCVGTSARIHEDHDTSCGLALNAHGGKCGVVQIGPERASEVYCGAVELAGRETESMLSK